LRLANTCALNNRDKGDLWSDLISALFFRHIDLQAPSLIRGISIPNNDQLRPGVYDHEQHCRFFLPPSGWMELNNFPIKRFLLTLALRRPYIPFRIWYYQLKVANKYLETISS
jgi:hypothetical protein